MNNNKSFGIFLFLFIGGSRGGVCNPLPLPEGLVFLYQCLSRIFSEFHVHMVGHTLFEMVHPPENNPGSVPLLFRGRPLEK